MARIEYTPKISLYRQEIREWTYFIQSSSTRAIKIGRSQQPEIRLVTLQTAHDAELALLGITMDHGERELQRRFAPIRLRGEWFKPEPELLEFLRDLGISTIW